MTVPQLTTDRLLLRGHEIADLADSAALWANPDVVRFLGSPPQTREQAWAGLLRQRGHWTLLGYGMWVVVERATGRFAGEVGIANFERDITPPIGPREAGWVLAPWAHGQGFATEALRAVLAWHDATAPGVPVHCIIDLDNASSHRVAAKLGFRELERRTYHGDPLRAFER